MTNLNVRLARLEKAAPQPQDMDERLESLLERLPDESALLLVHGSRRIHRGEIPTAEQTAVLEAFEQTLKDAGLI